MKLTALGALRALPGLIILCGTVAFCQTGAKWQLEVVDSTQGKGAGVFSSLAIDRSGNLHLVYSNQTRTVLHYAFRTRTEKRWTTTTVDPLGGTFEDIAVDSQGLAHIAYNSSKLGGLHYAFWNGKQWQNTLIDPVKTGHQTSIQLDSHGNPRISYYVEEFSDHRTAKFLKYAYYDGKAWYIQTVDHRPGTGGWNSIALDHADHAYISYSIVTGYLGFAYMSQSRWEHSMSDDWSDPNATSAEHSTLLDSKSKRYAVSYSSLAIDAAGKPHVAYINGTDRTIIYAWRDESATWHQQIVAALVATGADTDQVSLKLDKDGRPHVVFCDSGLGLLRYARRDKDSWHLETIDEGDAGQYSSLSLDENDQPYVSYYVAASKELRVAHRVSPDSLAKR